MKEKWNWQEAIDLQPKGYVELNNRKSVVNGPLESIQLGPDDDMVRIKLKWAGKVSLSEHGVPRGDWVAVADEELTLEFPNLAMPYVIEDAPAKGLRIRFGYSIIYVEPIEGISPSMLKGLKLD
ncbi:MAG: hypothetical protein ACOYUZ_02010 [Patescibacteria group bacterium]